MAVDRTDQLMAEILQQCILIIRAVAAMGDSQSAFRIADFADDLPLYFSSSEEERLKIVRSILRNYERFGIPKVIMDVPSFPETIQPLLEELKRTFTEKGDVF